MRANAGPMRDRANAGPMRDRARFHCAHPRPAVQTQIEESRLVLLEAPPTRPRPRRDASLRPAPSKFAGPNPFPKNTLRGFASWRETRQCGPNPNQQSRKPQAQNPCNLNHFRAATPPNRTRRVTITPAPPRPSLPTTFRPCNPSQSAPSGPPRGSRLWHAPNQTFTLRYARAPDSAKGRSNQRAQISPKLTKPAILRKTAGRRPNRADSVRFARGHPNLE